MQIHEYFLRGKIRKKNQNPKTLQGLSSLYHAPPLLRPLVLHVEQTLCKVGSSWPATLKTLYVIVI